MIRCGALTRVQFHTIDLFAFSFFSSSSFDCCCSCCYRLFWTALCAGRPDKRLLNFCVKIVDKNKRIEANKDEMCKRIRIDIRPKRIDNRKKKDWYQWQAYP